MKTVMNEEYLKKGMDLKRLVLLFQRKLWLVLMMAVLGATLGGIVYQVVKAVRMPVEYEAVSKLYISFNVDESGEVYQYYNGYTWNEILDTDPVLDRVMENLTDAYQRQEVIDATTAEILSDIRLLTLTVEGDDEKFVREVMTAVENGLIAYADASEELKRIEVIRANPPERVFWDDKTTTACILGGIMLAAAALLALAFGYVLDEAVYIQEDAEKKYPYPVLGLLTRNQKGLQPYARELRANIHHVLGDLKTFVILDMGNHGDMRKLELDRLLNKEENDFLGEGSASVEPEWSEPDVKRVERKGEWKTIPFNENIMAEEECQKIRELGGVVVILPFGVDTGRRMQRILSFLKNQDCPVLGIIISQADEEFLNRYYG